MPRGTKSWSPQTKGCHSCPPLAQSWSPMSCVFWAWPKTVWILPLRINPQTLSRMRSQHLHRGQTVPACFPFKAWVWAFGKIYIKGMKIICLISVRECSHCDMVHQVLQHNLENKLHGLLGVTWKQRQGWQLWHPRFQIWDVTTKFSFLPPTALFVQLHWGRGKKPSVLTNWKINSKVAKEILFPNFYMKKT